MTTRRELLERSAALGLAATLPRTVSYLPPLSPNGSAGTVQTVRGAIDAAKLGVTLPHEHVCVASAGFWQAWPEYFGGRATFVDKAVARLKEVKAAGVDSIVDVTPIDVGRDVRLLEEVSRKTGLHIVACTGHWLNPSLSFASRTADELARFFTLEIERGIEGTGIKPGVIKVATDREGVTPFIDKALRAAARACKATGVPITTHTFAAERTAEKQAAIFEEEGADPAKICLGHGDDSADFDYLAGLARRGYTVGMDHLTWGTRPGAGNPTWQQRADMVKRLVDAGLVKRIFLSNDAFFAASMAPTGAMDALDKLNPDGMAFTNRKVIPYLKESGVSAADLRTMTVDNPRRFFGGGAE